MIRNLLSFFLILSFFSLAAQDSIAIRFAQSITPQDMRKHLYVLASDSLEGRETGMPGQHKAARYLASNFKQFGLRPGFISGKDSSYFQDFKLVKKQVDTIICKQGAKDYVYLKDFYAYGDFDIKELTSMNVVFLGYGVDATSYSDYMVKGKPVNIKDKAVIILTGEPFSDGKSLVTGNKQMSDWGNDWRRKAAYAYSKGAKLVIIITGKNQQEYDKRLNQIKEHLRGPFLGFAHKTRQGSAFFVSMNVAAGMLGIKPEVLNEAIASSVANKGFKLKFSKKTSPLQVQIKSKEEFLSTQNVLAIIPGTDKADEIIVLTAHYDHLGIDNGKIHYGADDDGTGTAALLEIAEAFMLAYQQGYKPRRTILIMPVTAEEKGLMGSEYYTDFPVYPLANTVADLNIDMIGRVDEKHATDSNYVYLIGADKLSSDLHRLSEYCNTTYSHLELDYTFNSNDDPNRFYYRSDHYNFAKNGIPVIFYFSGVHEDYHKPTDTKEKILYNKAAKITQLVFYTAWELANREERIVVDKK